MSKVKNTSEKRTQMLSLGNYGDKFIPLEVGKTTVLRDEKSEQNACIPVKACTDEVYIAEPDGKLIPPIHGQNKCDYLIYSPNADQTCFIELKGANIAVKKGKNPYDQIIDTIDYLRQDKTLCKLVDSKIEKHAFIASPGRQKIPRGVETKQRQLWQKLIQPGKTSKMRLEDYIHYVKVTANDRYSNGQQIICSSKAPIIIPFDNNL